MADMILPFPKDLSEAALVTHMGCMDGSGCMIMFLRAGGKKENVRLVAAGMLEKFIKRDLDDLGAKFVIFADIGLSGEHGEKYADLLEKRGDCVLLDHHITSLHLKDRKWCDVRQDICGTEMLRQYLKLEDESSRALAAMIQDHDLWRREDPRSVDLAAFTVFVGQDIFVERFVDRDITKGLFTPLEVDMMKIMTRRRDQFIDAAIRKVEIRRVAWGDGPVRETARVGYIISPEMNVSLLLDRLLEKHPDLDVACQINFEKGSVSLRSRGYDVSEFAKYFGGGGHKGASGHRISDQIMKGILEDIHGGV